MQNLRSLMAAAGLLLVTSCGGDAPTSRDPELPPGFNMDGGPFGDGGGGLCPSVPPKLGENCGPDYDEATSCELPVGECQVPGGATFVETAIFCCPDGTWERCGGTSPCDQPPTPPVRDGGAPAAAIDAAPAAVDAPAAAVDAPPAAPDALDAAPDVSPDVEPDAGAPDV
jgi:hypothetical protein